MRTLLKLIAAVVVVISAVVGWNYFGAYKQAADAVQADARNSKIKLWTYYQYGVNPAVLVVDLRSATPEASAADVFRALLQSAEALKAKQFTKVVLAHSGTAKFVLDGPYFRQLGQEYKSQNPIYTMRTLPENLKRLDGTAAYEKWTGGWLGVMNKQMEDFTSFNRAWFLDDLIKSGSISKK